MNNYSTTQANTIASVCGIASIILAKSGIIIGSEELQVTAGLVITLLANILQYVHRYRKGDLTMAGFRK